jgi:hypothetical protein
MPMKKAWYSSHVETNISEIPFRGNILPIGFNKYQLKTFRVMAK